MEVERPKLDDVVQVLVTRKGLDKADELEAVSGVNRKGNSLIKELEGTKQTSGRDTV
jgi:hypothetical protein